ncbi:GGDEF domain-containing protein, partial [Escherichia coli]|nr:GGDEF domain-containing protein [Escherichia coli]
HSQESGAPLSLILIDVDYFKRFNDYYGHQVGDMCLKEVAQALNRAVRTPSDLVARYGGEEFVLLLPNTDRQAAASVAQRL